MRRRYQPRVIKKTNSQTILIHTDTHGTALSRFFHSIIFFISAVNGLSLFFLWLLLDMFWIAATYISDEKAVRWTLSLFTVVAGLILIVIITLAHYCLYKVSFRELFVRMKKQMLDANHSTHLTQINVDNHSFFTEIRQLQWAFFDLVERLQIYRGYVPSHILHRLDTLVDGAAVGDTELPTDLGDENVGAHDRESLSTSKRDSQQDDVSYEQIQSFRSPHTSWRASLNSDSYSYLSTTPSEKAGSLPGQAQNPTRHSRDLQGRTTQRENSSGSVGNFSRRMGNFFANTTNSHNNSFNSNIIPVCNNDSPTTTHRSSLRNSIEAIEMGLRSMDTTVMALRILNLSTLLKTPDVFVKQFEQLTINVNQLLRISKGQSASFDIDMMVFFWTANSVRNHEVRASDTIRRIISKVRDLNLKWVAEKGYTPMEIGIGASSGPSLVGNVGADADMKAYTIYSPTHDKAVSFAGLCAEWHTDCIIDKQVFMRVRYHFVTRPLTFHHCVVSRRNVLRQLEDVHAFELGQKIETEDSEWMYTMQNQINASIWDQYNQAFDFYVSGERYYEQALKSFRQHLELSPNDVPTKKWIQRLELEVEKRREEGAQRGLGALSPAPPVPTQGAHQVHDHTVMLPPTSPLPPAGITVGALKASSQNGKLSSQNCKSSSHNSKSTSQNSKLSSQNSKSTSQITTTQHPSLRSISATGMARRAKSSTQITPLKKRTRSHQRDLTASPPLPPLALIRSNSASGQLLPVVQDSSSPLSSAPPTTAVHHRSNSFGSAQSRASFRMSMKSAQLVDLSDDIMDEAASSPNSARSSTASHETMATTTVASTGQEYIESTSNGSGSKRGSLSGMTPQRRSSLVPEAYLIQIEDLQNIGL